MRCLNLFLISLVTALLFGCEKPKEEDTDGFSTVSLKGTLLVLNEGLFQQNNSTIHQVNFANLTLNTDFFEQKANRQLGDTGNDLAIYGGKIYVVMNVSSTLEILDANSGKSIKQIQMKTASGTAKQPRSICFANGKAFISCFDGFVDVLDTNSIEIIERIQVGTNPDQITAGNGKVFVSNSGGLNFPILDSTVSIIDASSLTELSRIIVGKNPGSIQADALGNVLVSVRGNYTNLQPKLMKIAAGSAFSELVSAIEVVDIELFNSDFIVLNKIVGGSAFSELRRFSSLIGSNQGTAFATLNGITKPYDLSIDEINNRLYISDAKNFTVTGEIFEFSVGGNFIRKFGVGLNPTEVIAF